PAATPTLFCDDPDVAPRLWINSGEIPGNGVDDDMNGFRDDVNGWNFTAGTGDVCRTQPTTGLEWHDTLVARIAVGETDNGAGGAGVAGGARILPLAGRGGDAHRPTF